MREETTVRALTHTHTRLTVCMCFLSVIIIPIKSTFLNPVAQADTLNKIILIPHGKRNENEEINMEVRWEGWCTHSPHPPISLSHFLFHDGTLVASLRLISFP